MNDSELLQRYVDSGSAEAFERLMSEHLDLVYSAARRQMQSEDLAQDVTQAVFILLSRKAGTVRGAAALPGWLLLATYYAARDARKQKSRRRHHEQKAARMSAEQLSASDQAAWETLVPDLDAALAKLNSKHRSVIALHFMQGRTFRDVGETLGISEDAARLSCARAVEKLRGLLRRRGALPSAAILAALMTERSTHAAPIALREMLSAHQAVYILSGASTTASGIALRAARTMELARATLTSGSALTAIIATVSIIAAAAIAMPELGKVFANPMASAYAPREGTIGVFRSGGTAEFVAMSRASAPQHQWWKPDGSTYPMPRELPAVALPNHDATGRELFTFAFRVEGLSPKAHDLYLMAGGQAQGAHGVIVHGTTADANARTAADTGLQVATAYLYPEQATTNLVLALSVGGWDRVMLKADGAVDGFVPKSIRCFVPATVESLDGKTALLPAVDPFARYDYQAVAIGVDGRTLSVPGSAPHYEGFVGDGTARAAMLFDAPLSKISGFQLSIRHSRDWVVFRHVALAAGAASRTVPDYSVNLCDPDKDPANEAYLSMLEKVVTAVKGGSLGEARVAFSAFSAETDARMAHDADPSTAYLVVHGRSIMDQLHAALATNDASTALSLLDAGTDSGNQLWQMVTQLSTARPAKSILDP